MRKSIKVTAIYQELKQAVGSSASQTEILSCAASLVELFSIDEEFPSYDLYEGREPYEMTPVDSAMDKGCWRTLCQEWPVMGWEDNYECFDQQMDSWFY